LWVGILGFNVVLKEAKLKQLTKHTWAEIEQMIKQQNSVVNTAETSNNSCIENKNMDKGATEALDMSKDGDKFESDKITARKAHTDFLENPLADGAIDALLRFHIGYCLSADNDENMRTGRLMMALTAYVYLLSIYDSKIPKKKNKNLLK
jgi:hypothetical protein